MTTESQVTNPASQAPAARTVPSAPAAPKVAPEPVKPVPPQPSANSHPTILYVDDDGLSREVMKLLVVKAMGFPNLTMFEDSANFMEKMRELVHKPDVIFLDIQIFPHDGYEMLKMLRADEHFKDATVIAMTASVMATDVQALRTAGFDGLIGKPIMRQVFPSLLKQILAGEPVWFVT